MRVRNIPAKFHPDAIWNDGALGFLKSSPQEDKDEQQQQDEYGLWHQFLI